MRAEIISIGDELTSGQRLDTNSQWLSQRLDEIGIPVAFHTTVGDDLDANIAVFRTAIERADIVVSTGGLGPTADDLTRDAIAAAAGVELVEDAAALAHIKSLFARRKREMPERNKLQAQFPRGSRVVPNPEGTAPGIDFTIPRAGKRRAASSHCPACRPKCSRCGTKRSAPHLAAAQPEPRVICHRRIKCFGVGESDLEAMLPDMIRRKREPLVGITVHGATITLRITASGPNEAACRQAMEPTVDEIYKLLGVLVFGEEDDELEHAVVRLLNERGRIARCGRMGDRRTRLAMAGRSGGERRLLSRRRRRSRQTATLTSLLKVESAQDEPASAETAAAMARAIQQITGATYGLGIAAFPTTGPPIPTAAAPHSIDMSGTLHVALATGDNVRVKAFPIATHPSITKVAFREASTQHASAAQC